MAAHPKRRRPWLRLLGAFTLLIAVGMQGLAYMHARAFTHFAPAGERTPAPEHITWSGKLRALVLGARVPHPINDRTPADLGLAFETVKIKGDEGDLELWVIRHPAPRGVVLLVHGYSESKKQVLPVARRFYDLGWTCVLVDLRGSGGSEGDRTSIGYHEARDVVASVRWINDALAEPSPLLYGFSMGSATVLRAVAVEHVTPRAMIVEAVFDRMLSTVEHRFAMLHVPAFPMARMLVFWGGMQNGFNGFRHNPVDYASAVTCPTLVLHGADDERVKTSEARAVFDGLRGPKSFHVFDHAGHQASLDVDADAWAKVIEEFLAKAAGKRALGPSLDPRSGDGELTRSGE
ncbi:MAG: alpha/beta fold hydrolase [Deltaproteobacteria bacterium]|nr:alpha/beta fold hydrolase [Deltaproteobacteria bacterium]